jgi:hypothetical protein
MALVGRLAPMPPGSPRPGDAEPAVVLFLREHRCDVAEPTDRELSVGVDEDRRIDRQAQTAERPDSRWPLRTKLNSDAEVLTWEPAEMAQVGQVIRLGVEVDGVSESD